MNEVTKPNLPVERTKQHRGVDKIDPEDRMVPRVKLIQVGSPEIKDKIAEDGDLVNSLTKENYGKSLRFIPILYTKTRILFMPRKDGGGIECSARNGVTGNSYGLCAQCEKSKWTDKVPPVCTTIINLLALIVGKDAIPQLVCISFGKTSYVAGRNLINMLSYKNVDTFNYIYDLYSEQKSNDQGTFNVLKYKDLNEPAPDKLYKLAEKYYNDLKVKTEEIIPDDQEAPF